MAADRHPRLPGRASITSRLPVTANPALNSPTCQANHRCGAPQNGPFRAPSLNQPDQAATVQIGGFVQLL
jgi:hypothetical protein